MHGVIFGASEAVDPSPRTERSADQYIEALEKMLAGYELRLYVTDAARIVISERLDAALDEDAEFKRLVSLPIGRMIEAGEVEHGRTVFVGLANRELEFSAVVE